MELRHPRSGWPSERRRPATRLPAPVARRRSRIHVAAQRERRGLGRVNHAAPGEGEHLRDTGVREVMDGAGLQGRGAGDGERVVSAKPNRVTRK